MRQGNPSEWVMFLMITRFGQPGGIEIRILLSGCVDKMDTIVSHIAGGEIHEFLFCA